MYEYRGSLGWQALLIALTCLVADVGSCLLLVPLSHAGPMIWVVLAAGALADLALAGPARTSGVVAVLHAVLVVVSPLLLPSYVGPKVPNNTGLLIAGYRAGAWLRLRWAVASLVTVSTAVVFSRLHNVNTVHGWPLVAEAALTSAVLPWLVGRYTTARRASIANLERQAERRRDAEQDAVRQAVTQERSAIARDLHDVISHHVSAIGVHAGAARMSLASTGESPAHRSLTAVELSSRSAMVDLRRLLDLLHGQGSDAASRQPGLADLGELLDGIRRSGLAVRLTTTGRPVTLPGSPDIALYRVAQEALTNALRHGDGGPVDVHLAYLPAAVELTVTNPTRATTDPDGGHREPRGLAGIRERVALFGGEVSHGPVPATDGGPGTWQLRARLPVDPATPD